MNEPEKLAGVVSRAVAGVKKAVDHDQDLNQDQEIKTVKVFSPNGDHDRGAPVDFRPFDDISRVLHSDPLFITAQDEWGAWPEALWNACAQLGIERVRDIVLVVHRKTGIKNRSNYLFACLRSAGYQPTGKRRED